MFDAVVLAGGSARRLGGLDKVMEPVGGHPMLEWALRACAAARMTVVVGGKRDIGRSITWTMEDPPGGGPLAATAAGLRSLPHYPLVPVVVLAGDLPYVSSSTVDRLLEALDGWDAAILSDAGGRWQPLAGAYARPALDAAVLRLGQTTGRPVRLLLNHLRVVTVVDARAAKDCDTPEQLKAARADLEERT